MEESTPEIVIVDRQIDPDQLAQLVLYPFGDMVKLVVDIERKLIAVGGELHADAEHLLLESGSRQADLWGANYFPGRTHQDCIEYTAMINIRPSQKNRGMLIEDPTVRERVRELTFDLIGRGSSPS